MKRTEPIFLGLFSLLMTCDLLLQQKFLPPPVSLLKIQYHQQKVHLGTELRPAQAKEAPEVVWQSPFCDKNFSVLNGTKKKYLFTLLMIDPDAPSRKNPSLSEILHWMRVNILGTPLKNCSKSLSDLGGSQTITSYLPPNPPEGSKVHRYFLLLFRQSSLISLPQNELQKLQNRTHFSAKSFADLHNLSLVAWNFFTAQTDDYSRAVTNLQVSVGFQAAQIIPNLYDSAPVTSATVIYPGDVFILGGNELQPQEVKVKPEVHWRSNEEESNNSFYCLFFGDLDPKVNTSNLGTEFLQWLVVDIPGGNKSIEKGQTLVQYIGPRPSQSSGLHQYVFLIFKQTSSFTTFNFNFKKKINRTDFNLRRFVRENRLETVSVSGNYFLSRYHQDDDSVNRVL